MWGQPTSAVLERSSTAVVAAGERYDDCALASLPYKLLGCLSIV